MITTRLASLREEMKKRGIDAYIVPTADFHESEYVGAHFCARKYITGFTGSAGTAVVTRKEAGLWTDARYFIQAEQQLQGSTVTLFKMREEGVPTILEYLEDTLKEGAVIGFDGRVVNGAFGANLKELADKKNGSLRVSEDLVDLIWENRPELPKEPVMILSKEYAGKSVGEKLEEIRGEMTKLGAELHITTSLCDIAWILNVRGGDISHVPVVLSYLAIGKDRCIWFVQDEVITEEVRSYLEANGIETAPYDSVYEYAEKIPGGVSVLLNRSNANYRICSSLHADVKVIDAIDPSTKLKAVKNAAEMAHTRNAHIKDAVAMCKFMYWLKKNVGKIPMTEISAADYLEQLRREQEGFLDLSFGTICAYGEHAALCHYSATEESDVEILPEGFLLVDSGGHYMDGTTDITRTFAVGPITEEMRENFTRVCRANINLAATKFLYGCTGMNLDIIAREPLWEVELDYKHGTGHGVGHILNVHEGPNSFRWQSVGYGAGAVLEEGMITSDEPGLYLEGKYGIRTENEILCRKGIKNEYGQYMYFEQLTFVPIDLDAIDPQQMTKTERMRLNAYHKEVYEKVAPYLLADEVAWLKEATREI